jgi:outer membrane lipoprotein-sorting protein
MKRMLTLAALFLMAPTVFGDDATDARKIIDKAIKASGRGDKVQAVTMKGKGTFYGMGGEFPYTGEWAYQLPDKMRMNIQDAFTLVVNGNKGWMGAAGSAAEMSSEQFTEQKEAMHAEWIAQLVPLKGESFTLAAAGETKVNDKPAVGVKVSHAGHRDVTLYFDKETGLLAKIEHLVKDETGKELKQESVIKEYAKVGDMKVVGKMLITRDGMKYIDGEMFDFKYSDSLPDSTFEKP